MCFPMAMGSCARADIFPVKKTYMWVLLPFVAITFARVTTLPGQTRPARPKEKFAALQRIDTVNGVPLDEVGKRIRFADLTPVFPDERLVLEHGRSSITSRVIDLCAPIGKGQRGLIVSPPKRANHDLEMDIAASITSTIPKCI